MKSQRILSMGGAVFLFLLAFFIYLKSTFFISWDLSQYIATAMNLQNEQGFINSAHHVETIRPGFVGLLTLTLTLTHQSLIAIYLMIVCYSALLSVFLFLVMKRLSNFSAALFVGLLWVLTPSLTFWIPRHLDALWPLFFLMSVWFLLSTENKPHRSFLYGCICGLMLACMLLIKASLVLLVLFPFGYVFFLLLTKTCRLQFLIGCYASLISIMVLIEFFVPTLNAEYAFANQSYHYPLSLLHSFSLNAVFSFIHAIFIGIYDYFTGLNKSFPSIEWMILALCYVTVMAWRQNKRWFALPLIVMLCIPHVALSGLYSLRVSQNLLVIAVLYMALGLAVDDVVTKVRLKMSQKKYAHGFQLSCLMIIVSGFLFYQYFQSPRSIRNFYGRDQWIMNIKSPLAVSMRGGILIDKLPEYSQSDYHVLVSDDAMAHGLYIASHGIKPINVLPFQYQSLLEMHEYLPGYVPETLFILQDIFYFDLKNDMSVLLLSYSELKKSIEENAIKYMIISSRSKALIDWLNHFSGVNLFQVVRGEKREEYYIYEVKQNWPPSFDGEPLFSKKAALLSDKLKNKFL